FWRQTALNEPDLWTNISFDLTKLSREGVETAQCAQLLNSVLERSSGHNLRVQIKIPGGVLHRELVPWQALFDALQGTCTRWVSLQIASKVGYHDMSPIFPRPSKDLDTRRLERLQALSLQFPFFEGGEDRYQLRNLLKWVATTAPKLKSISHGRIPAAPPEQLVWENVTFLRFSSRRDFTQVASRCANLETLILDDRS
ncbi:hypothetical protein PQX77_003065, partial [Marasmius sp. AFHP31]